ncbi:hypothetical protein [Nocardioides panacisoli]
MLVLVALDIRRPFSRADAVALGLDPRRLEGSGFRRVFRGVYVAASVELTPSLRAEAALVPFHPTSFASHVSAARLHGVPIPVVPDEHVSVLDRRHRRERAGIRCHLASTSAQVREVRGVRVSGVEQMFVELGELLTLVDLVVVGDHLVRTGRTTPARLREFCARASGSGARPARAAAAYVRERVDSPMETRLRMLIVLGGLPEPDVNLAIRDQDGMVLRRHDLRYRRSRTVIEYDGRHHIEREHQWEADLDRREETENDGDRVIIVVASGIYGDPGRTLARIWRVLRERGEPDVPSRLSDAWRPHFPARTRVA